MIDKDIKEKMKVVLVDDDSEDRYFFQEVIEDLDLAVELTTYKNGQEFLDVLLKNTENKPDLVFLDLNMPILNGLQTLMEIRKINNFRGIPIIAIYSTSTAPQDQADTFKNGANAYISKPNDYKDLRKVIKKVIEMDWEKRDPSQGNFLIKP